jgi:C-terminal processing protease CtpA/Prc
VKTTTLHISLKSRFRCGDRLLAVDGHSLENVKHATAVKMLKQTGTRVTLEVVSWLGTEL